MKLFNRIAVLVILNLAGMTTAFAQTNLPPVPTMPNGEMLDVWEFSNSNYLSLRGFAPTTYSNVPLVTTWAGTGLQVDATNAAYIVYRIVETNGQTNLNLTQGTISMWFSPNYSTGDDMGAWGTLLEVGTWNTNLSEATGAWGLYLSEDLSTLCFSAQTNGVMTNYLNAPISWNAGEWHQITMTYSATNSVIYLEGQFVTNGPGVTIIPDASAISNGFAIGSDAFDTALKQSHGIYNDLITYNYQQDSGTISNYYADESQNVSPLPATGGGMGGFFGDSDPPPSPSGSGGGTNSGGTGGSPYFSQDYGTNFFLEALPPGTNEYNSDSNSLTIILTNTIAYDVYQLWSTTNLQGTNTVWVLEQQIVGSTNTNFSVAIVSIGTLPQKFFKASDISLDSDGGGLPSWWQLKYFGELGNDPYADVAGDGWNNLEKLAMGISPSTFVTPAASSTFAVSLNTNGNTIMSWQRPLDLSSTNAVTGYTITYSSPGLYFTTNVVASQTNFSVPLISDSGLSSYIEFPTDYFDDWVGAPTITFQINYTHVGSQILTNTLPFDPTCFIKGAVVRGSGGAMFLAISSPSQNLAAVRLISMGAGQGYPINTYGILSQSWLYNDLQGVLDMNFQFNYVDIPIAAFTNGLYQLPSTLLPIFTDVSLNMMGVGNNGNLGNPIDACPETNTWDPGYFAIRDGFNTDTIPFLDGRSNIAQNIEVLLCGAGAFGPFSLNVGSIEVFSNYVTSGFSFVNYDRIYIGYAYSGFTTQSNIIERNEFEPFEQSAFLTNILFSLSMFDALGNFTNQVSGIGLISGFPYILLCLGKLKFSPGGNRQYYQSGKY